MTAVLASTAISFLEINVQGAFLRQEQNDTKEHKRQLFNTDVTHVTSSVKDRRCGSDSAGFESRQRQQQGIVLFFSTSRPTLDPPGVPCNGQREVKRLEREATRSLASRV